MEKKIKACFPNGTEPANLAVIKKMPGVYNAGGSCDEAALGRLIITQVSSGAHVAPCWRSLIRSAKSWTPHQNTYGRYGMRTMLLLLSLSPCWLIISSAGELQHGGCKHSFTRQFRSSPLHRIPADHVSSLINLRSCIHRPLPQAVLCIPAEPTWCIFHTQVINTRICLVIYDIFIQAQFVLAYCASHVSVCWENIMPNSQRSPSAGLRERLIGWQSSMSAVSSSRWESERARASAMQAPSSLPRD